MKFLLLLSSLLLAGAPAAELPHTPAFAGAEGAGQWAKGGRGGRVIAVTSLEDSGPGTLRGALNAKGPRTVVFRMSGTIDLKTALRVREPFVLQIGQTHGVIVRHLCCRPGDKTSKAGEMDALTVWDAQDEGWTHLEEWQNGL